MFVQLYAGIYGTNQTFIMRIPEVINSSGPNDWQFSQYYRVLFTSKGANMAILFQNRYRQTLISDLTDQFCRSRSLQRAVAAKHGNPWRGILQRCFCPAC